MHTARIIVIKFFNVKNESPNIVVVKTNMGGKLMANNSQRTFQMLCVPSLIYFDANQNTILEGNPNMIAAMSGLFFQKSHMNWEFMPNQEKAWATVPSISPNSINL